MQPLYAIISFYVVASIPLFLLVYNASKNVIDEEFHIRQGQHYCNGSFHIWDPKITTFPGLYITSAVFLYPVKICTIFALRLTSLVASVINVFFIHEIRRITLIKRQVNPIKMALESFNLSILPPMYLFAHLYYTDILSLTAVLGLILYNLKQRHNIATIFGFFSVLVRQTNIVWVALTFGCTFLDKLMIQTIPFVKGHDSDEKKNLENYSLLDIFQVIQFYFKRIYLLPKQIQLLFAYLFGYILVLISFIAFVLINGSIVVGDKDAHEAAIHLPQIFYFCLFVVFFSPSLVLNHIPLVLMTMRRRWTWIFIAGIVFAIIIYKNTIVHPYLLADNRHYVFYIWNKFYGHFTIARYAMIPIYVFALILLGHAIENKSAGFILVYSVCMIVSIALQQLIELRYFIIPFIILRLHTSVVKSRWLVVELIFYIILNFIVFYLFATKEIFWSEYEHVQRLIW